MLLGCNAAELPEKAAEPQFHKYVAQTFPIRRLHQKTLGQLGKGHGGTELGEPLGDEQLFTMFADLLESAGGHTRGRRILKQLVQMAHC